MSDPYQEPARGRFVVAAASTDFLLGQANVILATLAVSLTLIRRGTSHKTERGIVTWRQGCLRNLASMSAPCTIHAQIYGLLRGLLSLT